MFLKSKTSPRHCKALHYHDVRVTNVNVFFHFKYSGTQYRHHLIGQVLEYNNIILMLILWIMIVGLTHWGRMTHICVSQLITIVSDNGLSPDRRQAIIRKKWWNIVIWTRGKKFQWNLNRNFYIFIQENAFENVVWKMATILSRPQCVKNKIPLLIPHSPFGHRPLL